MASVESQKETFQYQTAVKQLLHLVTHSLYSNKEIFLRELISNASDAADKLRFQALSDAALYENDGELKIRVDFDKKNHTITVTDNGIGMTREDVVENLGTIARSGTKEFLESLTGEGAKDANLIGQFGVGFYSAFVVSDRVLVKSRKAGTNADQGVVWESTGEGDFSVENIDKKERGTEVVLHLKKDEHEFLDEWRLRGIITKYSDHILWPVIMKTEVTPETDDKEKEPAPEIKDEVVNRARALWTLAKSEIKDEEYKDLYKHISHDFDEPLNWVHNKVEGRLEYTSLLYIPKHAPFDLWNREQQHGLKLYVQRVFVMDDAKQLLPFYLRFIKGIVDSNDLPLNVSRELLQNNKVIEGIRSGVVKRILTMLEKMAENEPEKYTQFWKEFGAVMKEGPGEDFANKDRIAKLLRVSTTHNDTSDSTESLDSYISRMKEGQKKIYYIAADTFSAAKNSPHLEMFRKKGIEVILFFDRVDEWLVTNLTEYDGKQLQSVAKGDVESEELEDKKEKEELEKAKDEFEDIIKRVKEVLGDKVKEVRLTHRLTGSPACLVTDNFDMSANMQRIMQAAGQDLPLAKPILELNPDHQIFSRLKNEQDEERFSDWTQLLFGQALLAEGGKLDDPATFVKLLNTLLLS